MDGKYFIKDTALKDKKKDEFHYMDFVNNLKRIIIEHSPPFNIALVGRWGVGKSSIINLLKNEFEEKDKYIIHEINAWKYEKESLRKAFLKNLWTTLNEEKDVSLFNQFVNSFRKVIMEAHLIDEKKSMKESIKDFVPLVASLTTIWALSSVVFVVLFVLIDLLTATVTNAQFSLLNSIDFFKSNIWIPLGISPFFALFMKLIGNSVTNKKTDVQLIKPIETADEYEDMFKEEIKKYKENNPSFKKLIVILDDLDRLSSKKMVDALDAIKAFVDVKECIFVVACDDNILINAIEKQKIDRKVREELDGELFLDKLFQFRMPLPPIIENDMKDYSRRIAEQEVPSLIEGCNGQFDEVIKILIHADITTPRQVKKVLNAFANNLLIARNRENDSRKLEGELLTGTKGIKVLAKISVLQSDYNEIYNELKEDYKYLEDILDIYHMQVDSVSANKKALKLFNEKNSIYHIKDEYMGLVNFLIRTQHLNSENMAPFIYLAQDALGLIAGDKNQQQVRKNLISGNEKEVISVLEGERSVAITSAIIDELKNTFGDDLHYVIKTSYQLLEHVPKEYKKELSNSISIKAQELSFENSILWQVSYTNLINVYRHADNKVGSKNALVYVMKKLFNAEEDWKNYKGNDMDSKELINSSYELLDLLLQYEEELNNKIKEFIKDFIKTSKEEYNFFPFYKLNELYTNHRELFNEYFNIEFYHQLIDFISLNKEDINSYEKEISTLFEVLPILQPNYEKEITGSLHVVLDIDKNITNDLLNVLLKFSIEDQKHSKQMIASILKLDYNEDDEIKTVLEFFEYISFSSIEDEDIIKGFDNFFYQIIPSQVNSELSNYSIKIGGILAKIDGGFKQLDQFFGYIKKTAMEEDIYDSFIDLNNKYFSDDQRKQFFSELNKGVMFSDYNPSLFSRAYQLYSVLIKHDSNHGYIYNAIKDGIVRFNNNSYAQNVNWAENFVKFLPITVSLIEHELLKQLVQKVFDHVSTNHKHLAVKALSYLGKEIPKEQIPTAINKIISLADSDVLKMEAFEFLLDVDSWINKSNDNLSIHAEFIVENLELNPGRFLEVIHNKYNSLGDERLITMINNVCSLKEENIKIHKKIIQSTISKLFSNVTNSSSIMYKVISENDVMKINELVINSLVDKGEVLPQLVNNINEKDNEIKEKLIRLFGESLDNLETKAVAELFASAFNTFDDIEVENIYDCILDKYSDYKFYQSKYLVSPQVLPLFKKVNTENKVKVLKIARNFGLENELKKARKNQRLNEKEAELVKKIYNLRDKKISKR